MSYGGDDSMRGSDDAAGGFFGGNSVFGGDPCFAQNVLIGVIVLYLLYTFVYLPSQNKGTEGYGSSSLSNVGSYLKNTVSSYL